MQSVVHWLAPEPALRSLALGLVLLTTLTVGVCVHELLHLVPLSLTDASYAVTVLPSDDPEEPTPWAALRSGLQSGLVRVEVTHVPPSTPEWVVRAAAILPVSLALPLVLVVAGVLPDPVAAGDHVSTVALVALTGCGLPSPADWSVVWHGSALAEE